MKINKSIGFALACVLACGGMLLPAQTAQAEGDRDSSIAKESAIPYFDNSVSASKQMSLSSLRAKSICKRIPNTTEQEALARMTARAQAALLKAYENSTLRYDLYLQGVERVNTRKEREGQRKTEKAIKTSTRDFNTALIFCNKVGVPFEPGSPPPTV